MGSVMRVRVLLCASLLLGGCAAVAAVSAIPGVVVESAVGSFKGQDASLVMDMQRSLVAVQQGLERMDLHVNVLEPVAGGYLIEFGNGELDGGVQLKRQTQNLTTLTVTAHRGLSHQDSVETAMIKEVRSASEQLTEGARFDFTGYKGVYVKADEGSNKVGWFLPGQKLHVSKSHKAGWLKIKLPSGQGGYIKGSLLPDGG